MNVFITEPLSPFAWRVDLEVLIDRTSLQLFVLCEDFMPGKRKRGNGWATTRLKKFDRYKVTYVIAPDDWSFPAFLLWRHTKFIHCRDAPSVTQDCGIGLVRAVGEGTLHFNVKFFFIIRKRVVIGHIFRGPRGILRQAIPPFSTILYSTTIENTQVILELFD